MNAPDPSIPTDAAERIGAIVEFLAKLAGSLVIVWGFIARVWKPYVEWRRRRLGEAIRAALRSELQTIAALPERDKSIVDKLDLALERQDQVFSEIDLFVLVMADNRDRLDEMNELLNRAGYASRDRRIVSDRRRMADDAMAELQGRLRSRRRRADEARVIEEERDQ